MSIFTKPAWNYGHTITKDNKFFPIDEGAGEIAVELRVGSYTLAAFVIELNRALNSFLSNEYDVALDRPNRLITISANANFTIKLSSLLTNASCFDLVGFEGIIDLTGSDEYTTTKESGEQFRPIFPLQNFVDFEDLQRAASSKVNTSASGRVEAIRFGTVKQMKCNITLQTNITTNNTCDNLYIDSDPNGVNNLRNFMIYATTKAPMEFIPNRLVPNVFRRCILESTPASGDGVGFELRELYSRGLVGYFETGEITFREV